MLRDAVVCMLLCLLLAGCQVRVATDVLVQRDGSGTVALELVVDDELRDLLAEAGQDVAGAVGSAAQDAAWQVEQVARDDATGVRLEASFDGPDQLGERVAALTRGLDADDGALLRDVELRRTDDGGYLLTAAAGLEPPLVVGSAPVDEDAPRFDGDDLAALLAEGGDEIARVDLRVTFPTEPTILAGEGTVQGTSATLSLPNDRLERIEVSAPSPPSLVPSVALAIGAIGLGLGLLGGVFLRRR